MTQRKTDPTPKLFDSPEQQALINAMREGRLPKCRPGEAHDDDVEIRYIVATIRCPRCPLQPECRAAGKHERWGVWGGIDTTGRRIGDLPKLTKESK